MAEIAHEITARKAYELWENEGCPHGRDKEFWHLAESSLHKAAQARPKKRKPTGTNSKRETSEKPVLKSLSKSKKTSTQKRKAAAKKKPTPEKRSSKKTSPSRKSTKAVEPKERTLKKVA